MIKTFLRKRRGFTLVELLVVIAIVASLAGIAFAVAQGAMEKAKKQTSLKDCTDIQSAIENFMLETQGQIPLRNVPDEDVEVVTSDIDDPSGVISVLIGKEPDDGSDKLNPSGKSYLSGAAQEDKRGGIYRSKDGAGYYDPWGNPYTIIVAINKDEVDNPFNGKTIYNKRVIVYGAGPDGEGTHADKKLNDKISIEDNPRSWK